MLQVTVYSKPDCHLCDGVEKVLRFVQAQRAFEIRKINILDDPAAYERYRYEIPVILLNGREIARHRLTAEALYAALDAAGASAD